MKFFTCLFFLIFGLINQDLKALTVEERLDEKNEERALKIFTEIRCIACQGQAIESSNSQFSYQMRQLIRQKISEGKSDKEIKNELVQQFGDNILISSESNKSIWIIPIAFSLIGLLYLAKTLKLRIKISRMFHRHKG